MCSLEFWSVVNRTLAKAVLETLGGSRLQSSLVNCEKCTHFWLIYALLWVWRETTSSPPHPPAENRNRVESLQCFEAGALNCFLGQITLYLVVKRHFGGRGLKKKGKSREIPNVSLYWGGSSRGLTLELRAGLLPHSHKGNTRLFCTFSLKLHFPKEKGVGHIYLGLIMFLKCFSLKR
jgi:hypothetical protein